MKALAKILAAALAVAAFPLISSAYTWTTTAKYASYSYGNGYTVYNDVWGSGAGWQQLYVNTTASSPQFWVQSYQSGGGIKSYPDAGRYINQYITSIGSLHGYHNHWTNASGYLAYDWAYDIWVPSEVMVWTQWTSNVGPWGSWYAGNVSIGGRTWNVYKPGGPWSFLATSQYSSGTTDLAAILKWLVYGGHLSNGKIGNCQYGVEITSGNGYWGVNSVSMY